MKSPIIIIRAKTNKPYSILTSMKKIVEYDLRESGVVVIPNDYEYEVIQDNSDVLDKIRSEIADLKNSSLFGAVSNHDLMDAIIEIIDMHRAESEE